MALRGPTVGRPSSSGGSLRWARRRGVGVAIGAMSLAAISSTAVLAASIAAAPAKDSFTGRVTAATGGFAGDRGGVAIGLAAGTGQGTRHLTVTIRGTACGYKAHCVALAGKLTGTIAPGPVKVPDVGRSLTVAATGTVKPLGHVSAAGTVQGTGFLARGHESLKLRLSRSGATVTIAATSGLVPGFTSP